MRTIHHLTFVLVTVLTGAMQTARAFGDLWAISTDVSDSRVIRFDHETGAELPDGIPTGSAGLSGPGGIAISPDGNIYVSSRNTGQILFYDGATGAPLMLPGGSPGLFANLMTAAPAQLKFGPDGNLYVSEFFGTTVRVYDPATGDRLADAATGLTSAGGLAFAPNGDLLVGDGFGQGGRIVRVHSGTQETFGATGAGMLAAPVSMLFSPSGDLLVVDLLANYIARFDENGMNFQPFAVIPPPIPDPLPPGANIPSNSPADIVFDPNGDLIVAVLGLTGPPDGPDSGALLRYDLNGNLLETIADELEQIGGLAWTSSAATAAGDYDENGAVDTADYDKWKGDFGKWVAPANGADGNGNGIVDAADYTVWQDGFGVVLSDGGAGAAVPEPSTTYLMSGLVAGLLVWTRRLGQRQ